MDVVFDMDVASLRGAIKGGDEDEVRRLLRTTSNCPLLLATTDKFDRTPLSLACEYRNLYIISELINGGSDVNSKSAGGMSPLMKICFECIDNNTTLAVVQLLLKNGAKVNDKDAYRRTALSMAIKRNLSDDRLVRLLIQWGAAVDVVEMGNMPLLYKAVAGQNLSIVKAITEKKMNKYCWDTLIYTCCNSTKEILQLFMQDGANITFRDDHGVPLLWEVLHKCYHHRAKSHNWLGIFELLWQAGENVSDSRYNLFFQWPETDSSSLIMSFLTKVSQRAFS